MGSSAVTYAARQPAAESSRPGARPGNRTAPPGAGQVPVTRPGDAIELEAGAIAASALAEGRVVPPGLDVSTVRIHTGSAASRAVDAVGANAFAIGDDVVLGDAYRPGTTNGRRLLAHELAHVLQHRRRRGPPVLARDDRVAHVQLVDVQDLHAMGAHVEPDRPKLSTPRAAGQQVWVQDDDRGESRPMRSWEVAISPQNVDNGLASVKPNGEFWTLEVKSLTFRYRNGSYLTVPWSELHFEHRPEAAEWRLIHGVLYPLLDGQQTFDATNTPHILLGAELVSERIARAQRDRRVAAETVFSFQIALAELGGAVGPGDWLAGVAPTPVGRPARPSGPAVDPLDAELEQSFRDTFTEPDPELEVSGPVVEPEIAAGFSQAQVNAARRLVGRPIDGIGPIGRLWRRVTQPGQPGQLTLDNSRRLFNNQRARFWRAVRQDQAARAMFEDSGFRFTGSDTSAPVRQLSDGTTMQATIDHIVERQTDFARALDPTNLRISTRLENTVVLRQVTAQDPFQ